jgi:putative drug exporter of the RND superfamily
MFLRLGHAASRWRYHILGAWLALLLLALPFAPQAAGKLSPGGFTSPDMESQRAGTMLESALHLNFNSLSVIFSSEKLTVDDPSYATQANAAIARLSTLPEITQIISYQVNPSQVSRDRHTAYTVAFLRQGADSKKTIVADFTRHLTPQPDLKLTVGGGPVFFEDTQLTTEADLRRAEMIAFPFALIALLLVFRSIVAAAVPTVIGGASVVLSLALLFGLANFFTVSIFALNITTLFGLGLGVDYSLFMVSRFREELRRRSTVEEALAVTMNTAGRAVFFSGLAVSIGLLGLTLFPQNMLKSIGMGGVLTVVMAVLAAGTLLPALLAVIGGRVNALPVRLPTFGRTPASEESGFWHRLAMGVMRHPWATFIPVLLALLLLGAPYLSVRLSAPNPNILPASAQSRQAYEILSTRFDLEEQTPIVLAVRTHGSPLAKENLLALDKLVRSLQADSRVRRVDSLVTLDPRITLDQYIQLYAHPDLIADPFLQGVLPVYQGGDVTMVQVISKYNLLDQRSIDLVQAIRNTSPPSGLSVLVTGGTAGVVDYVNTLYYAFPIALLVVFLITFVVLALMLRSLVLPLKAILMNILSIAASYGALVFIFQEGHFSHLLNFTPLGFVEASGPILMFCALFGLSMDYEVFLLSRVREAWEHSHDNRLAVAAGMERSGRIITSAAAIVILVSAAFAAADLVIVKALGVGMALAVLVDATLIRGLLVPATMRLLGNINWYWPAWLDRLVPARLFAHGEDATSPPEARDAEPASVGGDA